MNEYQDQATWFEVQSKIDGRWVPVADADTDVEAEGLMDEIKIMDDELTLRVARVRGIA